MGSTQLDDMDLMHNVISIRACFLRGPGLVFRNTAKIVCRACKGSQHALMDSGFDLFVCGVAHGLDAIDFYAFVFANRRAHRSFGPLWEFLEVCVVAWQRTHISFAHRFSVCR